MSSDQKHVDEMVDRLVLDIEALVLLEGSEGELRRKLHGKLLDSHNENLEVFVKSLQVEKKSGAGHLFAMAFGELVLASFLVVAGVAAFVPNVVGITSPQALINYFIVQIITPFSHPPFYQYTSAIEFVIGALLLLAAFYTLRQAAVNLKEMGLSVRASDE